VVLLPFFLALCVCFWFPGLFSDLLRFAGIKASASAALDNLGRPTALDLARNDLVLVAIASCRLLSLFPR
jgi:hypothetical protein